MSKPRPQALAACTLTALLACAAAAQTPTPSDTTVSVQGIVRDAHTNKPISHALVTSQDRSMAVFSGREGRFEFTLHPPQTNNANPGPARNIFSGNVFFSAKKPGYLQNSPPANLFYDGSSAPGLLEIKLTPEAILKGHISTPGIDTPLNVRVQLMHRQIQDGRASWVRAQQAVTNSQGDFRIPDLPAGDYKLMSLEWVDNAAAPVTPGPARPQQGRQIGVLSARRPALPPDTQTGFPPVFYPNGSSPTAATPIHLEAGQTLTANLNLHPEPYFPVRIPILATEGGNGLNVRVTAADGNTGFSLGLNNARHTVEGALPNGAYDIEVSSFGPLPVAAYTHLTVAGGPAEAPPLTPAPSATIPVVIHEDFTVTGNNGAKAGGVIASINGQRNLNLSLRSETGDMDANLRNQRGESNEPPVLENVRPGRYEVQINAFRGYVAAATSGGIDLLHNPLVIGPGGASPPIEITLRDDTATLTGNVAIPPADNGTAQSGIAVYCFPTGSGAERFSQGYVGPDGKLNVPNIPPGSYLVVAFRRQNQFGMLNLEFRNPDVLRPFRTRTNQITLAPGGEASLELEVTSYDGD